MSTTAGLKRALAAALLSGAGAFTGILMTPAIAQAEPQATGPQTWCPGQYFSPVSPPNWDWNVCHTYWNVLGMEGNVSPYIWEGEAPPPAAAGNLRRPPVNCGLFYCQDPGGRY
jgi:hypothetical protein